MDRFAAVEAHLHREGVDANRLLLAADEMHLDPASLFIQKRAVLELGQIEVTAELAIDPGQQIQIEGRSHAEGVVIGRFDDPFRLLQIRPQQHRISSDQNPPDIAKHFCGRVEIEIANARSEKQDRRADSGCDQRCDIAVIAADCINCERWKIRE